jgi:hypothetical protein
MGTVTKTVVFTDLANYTAKVSKTDRVGLRRILADHEALVNPIISRYGGSIIKNLGDSFMILFTSATDAVRASLDIQDMVISSQGAPIRLSLNTGDVEEIDGDAFGDAVNLAARILSKTPSGEVWFGEGTYNCMNKSEIPWEHVNRFRLKGIAGDANVYRAVPAHRAWLPEYISNAVRQGNLVRFKRGERPSMLPPNPVILLEGFVPGSEAIRAALDMLPVLSPSSVWLSAYNISPADRHTWTDAGRGLVVGSPQAVDMAIKGAEEVSVRQTGSDTIVLDVAYEAVVELVSCGLALPSVPLSDVVANYSYDLVMDGRWVNRSENAVLRLNVTGDGPTITALRPGVMVNGIALPNGEVSALHHNTTVKTMSGEHVYKRSDHGFVGLFISDSDMRLGVGRGQTAEIGREPNHPGLAFPDRRGQENIHWCTGGRASRARAGGFTLDRALAGRRQASIEVTKDGRFSLTALHRRCPTYLFARAGNGNLHRIESTVPVQTDDIIVAGTTLIALRAVT